ncbi:hypothetical protein [Melittangium boletus]|uniref:hypothetical protein n=1 Tax=Melittangium boletus TaxID=83453 RepID=UPI003DA2F7F4
MSSLFVAGFLAAVFSRPLWETEDRIWLRLKAPPSTQACTYSFEMGSESRWSSWSMAGHGGDTVACGQSSLAPFNVTVLCECDAR